MSGIFNPAIFNNAIFNVGFDVALPDVVKTGTGGIDPGEGGGLKRRSIVKPLGTLGLPRKAKQVVDDRVDEAREMRAEIASKLAREFSEDVTRSNLEARPIASMSMAEVEFEIGEILRKKLRTDEDDVLLLLLMIAAAL